MGHHDRQQRVLYSYSYFPCAYDWNHATLASEADGGYSTQQLQLLYFRAGAEKPSH